MATSVSKLIDTMLLDKYHKKLMSTEINTLKSKVASLESLIDDGADPTAAIDKFNEIVDFLAGITNTETLAGFLTDISSALGEKYVKPSGGIPKTDLALAVQGSLDAADTALQYEATSDPTDAELVDEYERVLAVLYQAIQDVQQATSAASTATSQANAAKTQAQDAAREASQAATTANAAATNANQKAGIAQQAADNANAAMNAAKGSYPSLNVRLNNIEDAIDRNTTAINSLGNGKQDVINDLSDIRSGAGAGATAMQFTANNDPASLFS